MKLFLDSVQGAEAVVSIGRGRVSRMALACFTPSELPIFPTTSQMLSALNILGLPQRKERFPDAQYEDFILKTHIVRPFSALNYGIEMIYEYNGIRTITDTSTVSFVPSQLHPKDFTPLYVKYTVPGVTPAVTIKKVLTLNSPLPMRHLIIQQTIDHVASVDVINAFPSVNSVPWMGLPIGYWMFSGIEGFTDDDEVTYTYTATFTTKQKEDWSQMGFMEDDQGHPIPIPEDTVRTLRSKPYDYAIDQSTNGLTLVGMLDMKDFFSIFGV